MNKNENDLQDGSIPQQQTKKNDPGSAKFIYFYHPDHVGSTSYVTDASGEVFQHIEYFPFGETFVEENNKNRTTYLYNAKELDEETGLYYYGARYYDSKTQVWQSTDPKAKDFPAFSPYCYTFHNPLNYCEPDGREPDEVLKTISDLGFVKFAADYYNGMTEKVSYSFDSKPNRVFWSGWPVAMNAARSFAEKNDAITLEMTSEGQRLEKLQKIMTDLGKKEGNTKFDYYIITDNLWKQVSKGFAGGAVGKVTAVLRRSAMRKDNIYEKDEKPKLLINLQKIKGMTLKEIEIEKEEDVDKNQ
jgi:RHS repeat-associated protein